MLEVAADWHELMVPRRGMQPSIARDSDWTRGGALTEIDFACSCCVNPKFP